MQQQCRIAAVVEDHVGVAAIGPLEDAVRVVPVVVERLALDREHGGAGRRDGGGGVILRRVDVAAGPAHFRAERPQCFDQHCGLDRHVQRSGNSCTTQRLLAGELVADCDEARHFRFGDADFLAAPVRKLDVGDDVIGASGVLFEYGAHLAPSFSCQRSGRAPLARPAILKGAGASSLAGRLSDDKSCRNAPRSRRGLYPRRSAGATTRASSAARGSASTRRRCGSTRRGVPSRTKKDAVPACRAQGDSSHTSLSA